MVSCNINPAGMAEEEEERALFNDLGVTSANPEDIERNILEEARDKSSDRIEAERTTEEQHLDDDETTDPSRQRLKIFNKLRAVEFEIDAVAATVIHDTSGVETEDCLSDSTRNGEDKDGGDDKNTIQASSNGSTLQQALATDRLKSLKKTKLQLQTELSKFDKDEEKFLEDLVKMNEKPKQTLKKVQKSSKYSKKPKKGQKIVSFDEDVNFDAVLDAASAGFVETERDELVRKGILTPFHKLKGFERRLTGPQEGENEDIISATVARAVQSISRTAEARPTTKLLDANDFPRLDPPTQSFHIPKSSLKRSRFSDVGLEKKNDQRRKNKRPLPEKKWRKAASRELDTSGGSDEERDSPITSDYEDESQYNVNVDEDQDIADDDAPSYVTLEGGLNIPEIIFSKLFDYQKIGVQWLWPMGTSLPKSWWHYWR